MRRTMVVAGGFIGLMAGAVWGAAAATPTELDWYGPPGPLMSKIAQQIADDYGAAHPDTKVIVGGASTEGKPEALITRIVAGDSPDIVFVQSSDIGWWAAQGLLEPLDALLGPAGFKADEFIPGTWQQMQYQGHTYGLPLVIEPFGLVWAPKALESSGLDPHHAPATWSELESLSKKIVRTQAEKTTAFGAQFMVGGANVTSAAALTLASQWQLPVADDQNVYLDTQRWGDVLQTMLDLENEQGGAAAWSSYTGTLSGQFSAFVKGWAAGSMGFTSIGPWVIGQLVTLNPNAELDVAPMPVLPGGSAMVTSKGWNLTIPKGAPHPALAMRFLRYLMTNAPMEKWYRYQSSLPAQLGVVRYLMQAGVFNELSVPGARLAFANLAIKAQPEVPTVPISKDLIRALDKAITQVQGGKVSPQEALAGAAHDLRSAQAELLDKLTNTGR